MTVHVLLFGQTLCGMTGTPNTWPDDHKWTYDWDKDNITCGACKVELRHRIERERKEREDK